MKSKDDFEIGTKKAKDKYNTPGDSNNFSMNKCLLREVLVKKMIKDHDKFVPYKDDEGALRHKTREMTLNTISKFKSLKELFSNSTEVIKESYR